MGNLISCSAIKKDTEEEEKELYNLPDIKNYIYKYKCKINFSDLNKISDNQIYNLYLCENDLILQNSVKKISLIYNNILIWKTSESLFSFVYKNGEKNYQIILEVENARDVSKNLKKIVYELVDYYKNI
tara:strand:+ start:180 stop:566 length:387 start_codon:yes stop_codon:yes gene_type:complete